MFFCAAVAELAYAVGLGPTRARFPFAGGLTCSVQVRILSAASRFYSDSIMTRFTRFPKWLKILLTVGVVVFVPWFGWNRIAGAPDWLAILGLQGWFQKLHPLDSWIVAFTTGAAVIVALFQDRIRARLFRAHLDIDLVSGISIPVSTGNLPLGRIPAHHFRFGIRCRGPAEGKSVEALVTELWQNGKRQDWWSPTALNWTDRNEPFRHVLSPNTTRLCDFLMMLQPGERTEQLIQSLGGAARKPSEFSYISTACVMVKTSVDPNGLSNLLFPAKYVFALELAAANARPVKTFFEVEFSGIWTDGPDAAEISIRSVSRP